MSSYGIVEDVSYVTSEIDGRANGVTPREPKTEETGRDETPQPNYMVLVVLIVAVLLLVVLWRK